MQNSLHSNQHEYGYGDETPTASKVSLPEPATGGDMSSRFDDLARREQELAAREAQLNAKAEHIRKVSPAWSKKLLLGDNDAVHVETCSGSVADLATRSL